MDHASVKTALIIPGPYPRAADVVVFGAPGATWIDGKLEISRAARERAELAAHYWLSCDQQEQPMRVICVAGRPAIRSGMSGLPRGMSESAVMIDIMLHLGVPINAIRPNRQFPLYRELSISTVDEVAILVGAKLISPEMYDTHAPLAIVLHKRHGDRAIDILRKVGFEKSQMILLAPVTKDGWIEIVLRLIYRILILGGSRQVPAEVLKRRERRITTGRLLLRRTVCRRESQRSN